MATDGGLRARAVAVLKSNLSPQVFAGASKAGTFVYDYVLPCSILTLAFTIFSLYTVLVKLATNGGANPIVLAFLREVVATSVLLPSAYMLQQTKPLAQRRFLPDRNDLGDFMVLGCVMVFGVQVLSALAISRVTPVNYALLAPLVPVLTLFVALLANYEYFNRSAWQSWAKVAGIGITVAGAIVTATGAVETAGSHARAVVTGNLLLLVNKCCVSTYPVLEKRMLKKYDPLVIVAWGYATGSALTLLAIIPCALEPEAWALSPTAIATIFYAGLLSSGLNYAMMCWVNQRTSPVLVMSFYPLQSFMTPILAWVILGETVRTQDIVGGIIIISGLAVCVFSKWRETFVPGFRVPTGRPSHSSGAANGAHSGDSGSGGHAPHSHSDASEATLVDGKLDSEDGTDGRVKLAQQQHGKYSVLDEDEAGGSGVSGELQLDVDAPPTPSDAADVDSVGLISSSSAGSSGSGSSSGSSGNGQTVMNGLGNGGSVSRKRVTADAPTATQVEVGDAASLRAQGVHDWGGGGAAV